MLEGEVSRKLKLDYFLQFTFSLFTNLSLHLASDTTLKTAFKHISLRHC